MPTRFDRFIGDSITQFWITAAMIYTGYTWWYWGENIEWFFVAVCVALRASRAIDRIRRYESTLDPDDLTRPSLFARLFGHPIIAFPVILLCFLIMVAGMSEHIAEDAPFDAATMMALCLFSVPSSFLWRLSRQRRVWKLAQRPLVKSKRAEPRPTYQDVPLAAVLLPAARSRAPSVEDAMRSLQPSLLELVREGMTSARAEIRTRP